MIDLLTCVATILVAQTVPSPPPLVPSSASPPGLSWANLLERSDAVFRSRYALGLRHRVAAARRAANAVPGSWEDLSLDASADLDMQGNAPAEVALSATVGHRFGRRSETGRALQGARADRLQSGQAAQLLTFRINAVGRYAAWWEAASEAAHVVEARDAQVAYHARLKDSLGAKLVPAVTVAHAAGELAVLEGRLVGALARADEARRGLVAQLGSGLRIQGLPTAAVHVVGTGRVPWRTPQSNPWAQHLSVSSLQRHPALEALRREAALALAQGHAHDQADAPSLSFGAGVRQVGGGSTYGLLLVSGRFGLSGQGKSEAHVARGEAAALRDRVEHHKARLMRWFKAEHAQWPRLLAQRVTLLSKVEAPLNARVAAMQKAVSSGLATADILTRARRDLHEAHHQRLAIEGALWASHARARALALATTSDPARR